MDNKDLEQVILGSGNLYVLEFDGSIPEDTAIETDDNLIGRIKGGATLEYKPSEYVVKDDSGAICRRFVTNEEVKLKSGVLTWCVSTLKRLSAAYRYTETTTAGVKKRTLKLGGTAGRKMKEFLVRFVHTKADGDKLRCTIVGTSSNGFSVVFDPEKESTIDAEFSAVAADGDGTLVILEETVTGVLNQLTVTSEAGDTSGNTAITVTPELTAGNSRKYKIAAQPTLPTYDQVCVQGYTAWNGTDEIPATAGQTIVIVEVDADNKARGVGSATVVAAA